MKLSTSARIGLALVAVVVSLVAALAMRTFAEVERSAEESAQLALLDEAVGLLETYHSIHGRYPESLEALAFTFSDGGDRSTLARLQYESDGNSYSLVTKGAYTRREHRRSP